MTSVTQTITSFLSPFPQGFVVETWHVPSDAMQGMNSDRLGESRASLRDNMSSIESEGDGKRPAPEEMIGNDAKRLAITPQTSSDTDSEEEEELPYFVDKPQECKDSADLEFVLDSGERLPVHSTYLIAQSAVLCDIIHADSKKRSEEKQRQKLPLPDTTYKEACDFLVALYDFHGKDTLSAKTLPGILKIAHKFGMQKIVNLCDQRFSSMANYNGKSRITLWVSPYRIALKGP